MIELKEISKTFDSDKGKVEALKNVSLNVNKGDIYGVIGYSGAGKSTLIRCVNLLEPPTHGSVTVKGVQLNDLPADELRKIRQKIGMIFQGFNLLKTATVYENISIPLELTGVPKGEVEKRVQQYLAVVGLEDKSDSYPSQLSGGQKQRVAIARALAHEPEILLCDEATSALDPDTTESILDLLLKINRDFDITILLITHEMHVIQRVCDKVAVMDQGEIVEQGSVIDLFTSPAHPTTEKFVSSLFNHEIPDSIAQSLQGQGPVVQLSFVGESSGDPALAAVSKKFDVYPNILSGNVTQLKDQPFGRLTVHLKGDPEQTALAIQYLRDEGIYVEGEVDHEPERIAVSS